MLVLRQLILDTTQLQSRIERARSNVPEAEHQIRSLLEGLYGELTICSALLHGRISALPSRPNLPAPRETDSNSFWRLYPDQELDCREHLEGLLAGYGHYARNAYDSISTLENTDDAESVKTVNKLITAAEKGLCFIEIYLEGLALHMDENRLPAWPVSQMS